MATQSHSMSERGLALTKSFEGLRLFAYKDVAGIWTIGYGHTGASIHTGMTITEPQAEALLVADMATAIHSVNTMVRVPLNQNQFDALADFTYNAGEGSLLHSTLLVMLNAGHYDAVPDQLLRWDDVAGKPNEGLLRRRQAEAALFAEVVNA